MFQNNNPKHTPRNNAAPKSPQERYETCVGGMWYDRCSEYRPNTGICRQCGCHVKSKVKVGTEKCPLGKW